MFTKTIIDSDAFLDMPLSSQSLYFHLSMRADDDGFINNPKKIQRMIGGADDDLKLLIAKKFVIPFESGVCVIKHWKMHNYIAKDRYKETVYKDEKAMLQTKINGAYTLNTVCIQNDNKMLTPCIQERIQIDDTLHTQVRLGKVSIGNKKELPDKSCDIDLFFEECWAMYPNKKGKGSIKITRKKELFKLGNELKRAIQRYADTKPDWQVYQYGSTFFNSGYIDYLDKNYDQQEKIQTKKEGLQQWQI